MKILFLSHYFPPEVNAPATRTFEHCARWVKAGHTVTVVTCNPNHPRGELYPGYRNGLWNEETVEGIHVVRLWTFLTANKGFGLRTLNYVLFMVCSVLLCWRYQRPDVVISTSPQFFNGLAGYFVSRFRRVPWVLEIRDLWPESIVAVGMMKEGIVTRLLYWLERFCYQACDLIVPVTDAFRDYMIKKGIDSEKICVIKNGVDMNVFAFKEDSMSLAVDAIFNAEGLEGKFIAAYVGTHGMAHRLETVLEAAEILQHRDDIRFLTVGDGAERKRLVEKSKSMGLNNLIMVGQLPKSDMPAIWSKVHLSLILLQRSDTFKSVIPSKIFESLAMNKPIILGVEGESAALIMASGCGVCIEPESAIQLAEVITELADDRDRYHRVAVNGSSYVRQNFDRDVLASKFSAQLEALVSRKAALEMAEGSGE